MRRTRAVGILAYGARAEDDGMLVERMVQAFQLGVLPQKETWAVLTILIYY